MERKPGQQAAASRFRITRAGRHVEKAVRDPADQSGLQALRREADCYRRIAGHNETIAPRAGIMAARLLRERPQALLLEDAGIGIRRLGSQVAAADQAACGHQLPLRTVEVMALADALLTGACAWRDARLFPPDGHADNFCLRPVCSDEAECVLDLRQVVAIDFEHLMLPERDDVPNLAGACRPWVAPEIQSLINSSLAGSAADGSMVPLPGNRLCNYLFSGPADHLDWALQYQVGHLLLFMLQRCYDRDAPAALPADAMEALRSVVGQLLQPEPQQRHGSLEIANLALRRIVARHGIDLPETTALRFSRAEEFESPNLNAQTNPHEDDPGQPWPFDAAPYDQQAGGESGGGMPRQPAPPCPPMHWAARLRRRPDAIVIAWIATMLCLVLAWRDSSQPPTAAQLREHQDWRRIQAAASAARMAGAFEERQRRWRDLAALRAGATPPARAWIDHELQESYYRCLQEIKLSPRESEHDRAASCLGLRTNSSIN